jgi:hypothetical protein
VAGLYDLRSAMSHSIDFPFSICTEWLVAMRF